MTRCDYDDVFYRVFCVTLLGIACTFTIILSNVFIDIDGLIASKGKDKTQVLTTDTVTFPKLQELENNEILNKKYEVFYADTDEKLHDLDVSQNKENKQHNNFQLKDRAEDDASLTKKSKDKTDSTTELVTSPQFQEIENNEVLNKKYEDADDTFHDDWEFSQNKEDIQPDIFEMKEKVEDDTFRPKRSIVAARQIQPYRLTNPKMRKILNRKISTLLEELDAESHATSKIDSRSKNEEEKKATETEEADTKNDNFVKYLKEKPEEMLDRVKLRQEQEMLHLAMYNILLQGIVGHMNLNKVFSKVHSIMNGLQQRHDELKKNNILEDIDKEEYIRKIQDSIELKNLDQYKSKHHEDTTSTNEEALRRNIEDLKPDPHQISDGPKAPVTLIKAIIDIETLKNNNTPNINGNNVKGLIKLIYNGTPIKFSPMEEATTKAPVMSVETTQKLEETRQKHEEIIQKHEETKEEQPETKRELDEITRKHEEIKTNNVNSSSSDINSFLNKALADYLIKYPSFDKKLKNSRHKRHVKVRPTSITAKPTKDNEEELYVEIETHFDSKGGKGNKNKQLIKTLVKKIEDAIHANIDTLQKKVKENKENSHKLVKVKKREQKTLESKPNNIILIKVPLGTVAKRDQDSITKTVKFSELVPNIHDNNGETWKNTYNGFRFLSKGKSINSGEQGLVDLDYNSVLKDSGIPKRLQQPLSTGNIVDHVNLDPIEEAPEPYIGNITFYNQDIDGTGFAIGFNQYVGDEPDAESIKLFNGVQDLIKVYHHNYDETNSDVPIPAPFVKARDTINIKDIIDNSTEVNEEHEIVKRDVLGVNYNTPDLLHSNEYKVTFDDFLQSNNYPEKFNTINKKALKSILNLNKKEHANKNQVEPMLPFLGMVRSKPVQEKDVLVIDDNLFRKELKPAEIFGIASLLDRKKRSLSSKIKKYKLRVKPYRRYLSTLKFRNKKTNRQKRDIDKIRIIATDSLPPLDLQSNENVYVVSEDEYGDRALLRNVDEQVEQEPQELNEENDVIPKQDQPTIFNHHGSFNILRSRSRNNVLMSRYPHLFLEDIARSKEDEDPAFYSKMLESYDTQKHYETTTQSVFSEIVSDPVEETDNVIPDHYKITVNLKPQNISDFPLGFKKMYTSINKSISQHGYVFSSQVNVSELSKVEKTGENVSSPQANINKMIPMTNERILDLKNDQNPSLYSMTPQSFSQNITTKNPITETRIQINENDPASKFPLVKDIQEQQEKMRILLNQHKKRIDEQFETLKKEKMKIDSMIVTPSDIPSTINNEVQNLNLNQDKKSDTIDVWLPLDPPQMLHLTKEGAGQLISAALMKLHDAPQINDIFLRNQQISNTLNPTTVATTLQPTTTPQTTTTTTTTPQTTTTTTTHKTITTQRIKTRDCTKQKEEKAKILTTMQRNENLTNVILRKLDHNTDMLQRFLQILSERITPKKKVKTISTQQYLPTAPPIRTHPQLEAIHQHYLPPLMQIQQLLPKELHQNHQQFQRSVEPYFAQNRPNLEVNKNATHVSIPFFYAFQQPYSLPEPKLPLANIFYQGHIHTKAFNDNNIHKNSKQNVKEKVIKKIYDNNQTKFFIDGIGSMPAGTKVYDMARFKVSNNTENMMQSLI